LNGTDDLEKFMIRKRFKVNLVVISGLLLVSTLPLLCMQPRIVNASASGPVETRCGWFSNPTPANASLHDREDEWIISVQGGYQAEGDWPEFGPKQWVETNVHYGYGCACMRLQVNRAEHEVVKIERAWAKPLSVCRKDRSLKRWGFK
jgi:hypothetical protein